MEIKKLIKKYKTKIKTSIFISWVLSYCLIMLMPIILGTILYLFTISGIKIEVEKTQRHSMESIQTVMDIVLEDLNASSMSLLRDDKLEMLSKVDQEYQVKDYVIMSSIQTTLCNYILVNNYVEDYCVYFNKTGYLLTSTGYYHCESISEQSEISSLIRFGLFYKDFYDLINQLQYKKVCIINDGTTRKMMQINSNLNIGKNGTPAVTIIMILDYNAFMKLITMENSISYLIDQTGNYASSDYKRKEEILSITLNKTGDYTHYMDGSDYIKIADVSDFDLQFLNIIPSKIYHQQVNNLLNIMKLYLILCFTVGGLLAYKMAKKQYNPLKLIMDKLKSVHIPKEEQKEFNYILDAFQYLMTEKEMDKKRIEQQNTALQCNTMGNLVKGRLLGKYQLLDLPFTKELTSDAFVILAFDIEDASNVFFEEHPDIDNNLLDLIFYVIKNVATEFLEDEYNPFVAEAEGIMVCLVNRPKEKESAPIIEAVQMIAERIYNLLKDDFGVIGSAYVSDIHHHMEGIEICYQEIQEMIEYKNSAVSSKPILQFQEVAIFFGNDTVEASTKKLINFIHKKNYSRAEEIISQIRNNSIELNQEENRSSCSDIVEQVKTYIQENYRNQNLSVSMISDTFDINLSYLSQVFKKLTKIGLLEYIHMVRIEVAKPLLLDGMRVQDVAEAVGYYNTRPLIRVFKRRENMTPTEFKENYKK